MTEREIAQKNGMSNDTVEKRGAKNPEDVLDVGISDGLACHVCNENERGYFRYGDVYMYGCAQCGIGIIYGANKYQPTANEAKEIYEQHMVNYHGRNERSL